MPTNARLQQITRRHPRDITLLLKRLVKERLLVPDGQGRATTYSLAGAGTVDLANPEDWDGADSRSENLSPRSENLARSSEDLATPVPPNLEICGPAVSFRGLMKRLVILRDSFGPSVADGAKAHAFQKANLAPLLEGVDDVILDFSGIRSANSSFVNGLLRGLFAEHGEGLLRRITFKGCLPTVQVLVQGAIDLGLMHHGEASKPRRALR